MIKEDEKRKTMKTIQKTPLSLLLIVFLTAAACNTPAALGEIASPPQEAPAGEDLPLLTQPLSGEMTSSEVVGTSAQPLESGTVVFTEEPVETAGETHQSATPEEGSLPEAPAPRDTQIFSAEESLVPAEADAAKTGPPSDMEPTAADPADLPTLLSDSGAGCGVKGNAAFEEILLNLINQERANQGLNELVFDSRLIETARKHSLDMACQNFFNHTGSDGSNSFARIGESGYPYEAAGENIYAGSGPYNCAQEAFKAWMKSAAHQEVMLHQDFEEIGIGYAFNPDSTYGWYCTAVFASR